MSTRFADFFDSVARTLAIALVLALLATAGLWYALQRGSSRTVNAYFTSSVGLYKANTVNVQGIAVGTVGDIVPMGNVVRVELNIDNDVAVPANTKAVIVAPTLVSDRYVQVETYTGGPMLADGAVIPVSRTAVPVELDQVYKSLDTLATSLGPNGANQRGALNQLLTSSAGALGGNGEALKRTITEVAGAVGTLSDNRDNLFGTVDNLGQFTNMLARNDGNVRALNTQLADISAFLAAERGNLSEVLRTLPPALEDVARFIRDNRDILRTDVGQLASVTDALVRQRAALQEITDVAPLAIGNLYNVFSAGSETLDVRPILAPNLGQALTPAAAPALLCSLMSPTGPLGAALAQPLSQIPTNSQLAAPVAGATTICGAVLNPAALQAALVPFQTLLQALGQQNALNAALAKVAGANVGQVLAPQTTTTGTPTATPQAPGTGVLPNSILGFGQSIGGTR
jgi:virulence factor Mce-like protein